jgi:3-oxoacyl-[acyl-carrier-protein] synthase II
MLSTNSDWGATPRPFDKSSDGMIIGEGAALFVLEEQSRAKSRGAKIYGEVRGYGTCSGTQRIALQSTPDLVRCMKLTLSDAALNPEEIDCVYAQAAGIRQGDESELRAFQILFSGNGRSPAITSIKGHIGHTFAASGPLSMAAAIGVLNGRRISPTLHLESVDAQYSDLNLWPENGAGEIRNCLINTVGFGGVNAGLVVSHTRDRTTPM